MIERISDLLLQVQTLGDSIVHHCDDALATLGEDFTKTHPSPQTTIAIPILHLETPPLKQVYDRLRGTGVSDAAASELASVHILRSKELAQRYSAMYTKTCSELRSLWRSSSQKQLSVLYTRIGRLQETYLLQVRAWEEEMLEMLRAKAHSSSASPSHNSSLGHGRRPFNRNYTPTLEAFFERNQYPSLADRKYLAQKSGMELRQINIWFQNRRRRTKQTVQRTDDDNTDQSSEGGRAHSTAMTRRLMSTMRSQNVGPELLLLPLSPTRETFSTRSLQNTPSHPSTGLDPTMILSPVGLDHSSFQSFPGPARGLQSFAKYPKQPPPT
ncbi:hypothetical protein SCHPADRAFT_15582 [Schizopora paradoxa]|uniref:Homeobox domain-containing protein n=1 Tax=Schizopora paradoxa TaxID=27342 RepID=A0A0H2SFN0_9AGAM|nr:hypothetical protein SCHPADRAFT_15582 [Schizopora paradoxa]